MIIRSQTTRSIPLKIVGSSSFGIYPKIGSEKTFNMYITDNFLANYLGYQSVVRDNGQEGRGCYSSFNLNRLVTVFDNKVYLNTINYNQAINNYQYQTALIGNLSSYTNPVYIAENDTGQLAIVDSQNVYIYNETTQSSLSVTFTSSGSGQALTLSSSTAFTAGMPVTFSTTGTLPAPLDPGVVYYVSNSGLTGTNIQINTDYLNAKNGDGSQDITFTSAGTGTHTITQFNPQFYIIPNLGFTPTYITFHDTYFICSSGGTNQWRLGIFDASAQTVVFPPNLTGELQTKPDQTQAVVRFPSGGNMIFVFGKTVVEPWFDTGGNIFPYQRNDSFNIDYGCLNAATIAFMDEWVVWLGQNEKSGPVIFASNGGKPEQISTDGIDGLLYSLFHPEDSQAFLIRQNGHLFYHINFYTDNISLFYDFNTKKFYHACDENMNYFIASAVAFFNEQYYFVSRNNGNLYAFDTQYYDYDNEQIPRIRICPTVRMLNQDGFPTQEFFIANDCGFVIEQGTTNYNVQLNPNELETVPNHFKPKVDLRISYNGGQTFGSDQTVVLNSIGNYRNTLRWWQLGMCNEFTPQFRFWNMGRIAATDGILNIRQ